VSSIDPPLSPRRQKIAAQRPSQRKLGGVAIAGLGGNGMSSTAGYIQFQTQAFDQLVLEESKKELIRAVARNGGRSKWNDPQEAEDDYDDDELDELGIDVVANKGGASIFLLHGPPGCGKTLTAEAISELLQKPLYM
jgi:Cdc6-like AAA superfamily ATPase